MEKVEKIISSVFNSIQGEGRCAGEFVTFIRLYTPQCFPNRARCSFCDTVGRSYYGQNLELRNVLEDIKSSHVVITGGEPFFYSCQFLTEQIINPVLYSSRKILDKANIKFDIETNGSYLRYDIMNSRDSYGTIEHFLSHIGNITISPKLANSLLPVTEENQIRTSVFDHYDFAFLADLYKAHNNMIDFKFVIDENNIKKDLEFVYVFISLMQRNGILVNNSSVFFMPKTPSTPEGERIIAETCIEHGINFSPRLHVNIWGANIPIEK